MKNVTPALRDFANLGNLTVFSQCCYSFPQDRVIINRLDNICHVVLKGKWPCSHQYEPSGALPTPVLSSCAASRSSLSEPEATEHSFSNGAALAAQSQKVRLRLVWATTEKQQYSMFPWIHLFNKYLGGLFSFSIRYLVLVRTLDLKPVGLSSLV